MLVQLTQLLLITRYLTKMLVRYREIKLPCGNPIYNLERTLCDILRGSGSNIQIVNIAMKKYANFKDKDISKLMQYADQLHVKPKVMRYMEILL